MHCVAVAASEELFKYQYNVQTSLKTQYMTLSKHQGTAITKNCISTLTTGLFLHHYKGQMYF